LTWNHGLINVAMLPYESLCSKNVILQWDITKENCIKRIVYASSKCTCRKGTELAYRPQYNWHQCALSCIAAAAASMQVMGSTPRGYAGRQTLVLGGKRRKT